MKTKIRCRDRMLRDVLVRAGGVVAGTAIAFGALAPVASASPLATPAPSTPAVSAPGGVVEVDGHFTPQQQAALKAVLSSPAGRAQIEKVLGTVSPSKPGTASVPGAAMAKPAPVKVTIAWGAYRSYAREIAFPGEAGGTKLVFAKLDGTEAPLYDTVFKADRPVCAQFGIGPEMLYTVSARTVALRDWVRGNDIV